MITRQYKVRIAKEREYMFLKKSCVFKAATKKINNSFLKDEMYLRNVQPEDVD